MKQIAFLTILISLISFNSKSQTDPFAVTKDTVIYLVSGIETGSYYHIAQDLVKYSGMNIVIKPSKGAINNYEMLINDPSINIGIVQFDVLQKGKQHDYQSKTHISENLKVLLPIGYEEIHLITKVNSNILSLQDLAGKKVNVGVPSKEGTNITSGLIKSVTEVPWIDINLSFDSAFVALLKGEIDAMFFVGYAPIQKLKDLLPTYNQLIKLVPIKETALGQFHNASQINLGTYPWLYYDVQTYAVRSYLVTNIKSDNPMIIEAYEKLLKNIKENLNVLKQNGHPAWKQVDLSFKDVKWDIHPVAKKVFNLK